ncbi:sterile alpha motif domain-containing protein 3-like isoform X2 [Engraulis encrasicolus]
MASPLKLRVILADDNAEILVLPSRPSTVDELVSEIKTRFGLVYDFRLQYEDPDFNAFCNLVSIDSLPSIATVKVIHVIELNLSPVDLDVSSISTDDTVILSSPERSCRTEVWPEYFTVPSFTYEVEYILSQGNTAYEKEAKPLKLTKDQKHNILEAMAIEMYKYAGYPSGKQIRQAAEALVKKHPCLKEKTGTGYDAWKNSLFFKMGNYRTKLSRAGLKEVSVNAGKRSRLHPTAPSAHSQIKRPRRGEINYLPNYPAGESKDSLEAQRNELHSEFQKAPAERDGPLIFLLMQRTFALRREEIINSPRPIAELRERWPALFCEAQLYKEVHRITNQNLPFNFFAALDKYTPQLLNLYKEKQTGTLGKKMAALLSDYSKQDNDIQATRTAVLFGLALYLKEDASEIFKSCKEVDFEESQTGAVTLLALTEDNPSAVPFNPQHVTVILEDQVVLSHKYWVDALVLLFGLIYALHLEYPAKLKGFFEFIQVVLLNLDDGRCQIKPKLLSLKNELELGV